MLIFVHQYHFLVDLLYFVVQFPVTFGVCVYLGEEVLLVVLDG